MGLSCSQISWLVIATLLLGVACVLLYGAYEAQVDLDAWEADQPIAMTAIDLSQPGEIRVPVNYNRHYAHGVGLTIEGLDLPQGKGRYDIFSGLEGTLKVVDDEGHDMTNSSMPEFYVRDYGDHVVLADVRISSEGAYTAVIEITQGAPALADMDYAVSSTYLFCGMEQMAVSFAWVIGFLPLVASVLVLACCAWSICKARRAAHAMHSA